MTVAGSQRIELDAGATRTLSLTLRNPDASAFDLTNCTRLEFVARRSISDADTTISKTLGAGVAIVSAAGGTATVTLASSDTLSLSGEHAFDIHAVVSSIRYVLLRGKLVIHQAVNRA